MARAEVHVWLIDVDDESAAHRALDCLPAAEQLRLLARAQPHRRRALCANAALRILTAAASTGALPLPELAPDSRGQQVLHAGPDGPAPASAGALPLAELAPESRRQRWPSGLAPAHQPWARAQLSGAGGWRLHVSLSHAGAYAAVALSTAGPVGVDIEETEPLPDRERFARGILAAAERFDWAALPENARDSAVIRAFTRKEAVLKALGLGLAGGLREVAAGVRPGRARLHALPESAGPLDAWSLQDLLPLPGLAGAVALRAPAAAVHEHRTTIVALLRTAALPGRPARLTAARVAAEPGTGLAVLRTTSAGTAGRGTGPLAGRATLADATRHVSASSRGDRSMTSTTAASLVHDPAAAATWGDEGPPAAGFQVFCLPHAGGNSVHFRAWNWLNPYARVVPMDLPGHGSRLGEPLVEDWEQLASGLAETVAEQVDGPYALFGHSLGSLLAFDISHRLLARGLPPALLAAAGRNGPSTQPAHRPVHHLPEPQFIGALHKLGGMPDALLGQPELLQMLLPVLRADLRLAERYERPAVPPLPVPVMAFAGADDPMTDDHGMLAWKRETTSTCELVFLEGGHFFLDRPQFASALTERIARLVYPIAV